MIRLVKNELMKLFCRRLIKAMLMGLLLFVICSAVVTSFQRKETENWKITAKNVIEKNQKRLELVDLSDQLRAEAKNKITIAKYRLKNNIPEPKNSVSKAIINSSGLIEVVIIMVLLVAAELVSGEYNEGTIKLLLIRPYSRIKILLSKFLAMTIFAIVSMIWLLGSSFLINLVIYGVDHIDSYDLFINQSGEVVALSTIWQVLKLYTSSLVPVLSYATIAFFISTVLKNSAFAVGLSFLMMFMGNVMVEATSKIAWFKYLPFANSDMSLYLYHIQPRPEMNMVFSLTVLLMYIGIFLLISLVVFQKRDI